jgi:hypothetical protein
MQRTFLKILAIALLTSLTAYGQSLGDIARENRDKQAADEASGVKPVVITNKDLPATPAMPEHDDSTPMTGVSGNGKAFSRPLSDQRQAQQDSAGQRIGEQWRGRIEAQQSRIANLQARIDQLNAAIHATGGTVQYDQPYSRGEAMALQRVAQLQYQLEEQKRKLYAMQDAARHSGMHTSIYDP